MLCERCKIREATIMYTEVVNGVKTEHYFCTQCAQELNFGQLSSLFDGEFPFSKILSALLGENGEKADGNYAQIVCPTCGTSYQDFVKNSRFGCADCYELFDLLMRDSIKQLQGSDAHKGKRPKYGLKILPENITKGLPGAVTDSGGGNSASGADPEKASKNTKEMKFRDLKLRLSEAIRDEKYDEAAKYRDMINAMKKEGQSDA